MNIFVQQSIHINILKVGAVSNSSVLQIGSAGVIKDVSNLYNTGGFTGPAPAAQKPGTSPTELGIEPESMLTQPSVPLSLS